MQATPIVIDRDSPQPLHDQIAAGMRRWILGEQLRSGDRVPAIRELATGLGVSRTTVVAAYEQLVAEGYLVARVGSGTRVAPEIPHDRVRTRVSGAHVRENRRVRLPISNPALESRPYLDRSLVPAPGELPFDFRRGRPALDLFPVGIWDRLLRKAWRELTNDVRNTGLDYPPPAGDPQLRVQLAQYLRSSRGVRCSDDQVLVSPGAQSLFDTAARLWLRPGTSCVVEDPGYPMARRALAASGGTLIPVPVDGRGLQTASLPTGAAAVLVTPSWQYPLGGTMPLERRLALLRWASKTGAIVMEDDYDSEFRYEGWPVPSLQGIDEDGRVLYFGTLSKMAFPGLRLGFAVVPTAVRDQFLATMELVHRGTSVLEQRTLALFISNGHLQSHLRRLRTECASRQEALLQAIHRELGDRLVVEAQPAGLHLVGRLVDVKKPATQVAQEARLIGVGVTPLVPHRLRPTLDVDLLLNYSGVRPGDIAEGIRRLSRVISG